MLKGLQTDIVIMDEWVNAADKLVLGKQSLLKSIVNQSQVFVFASHREKLIKKFCNKTLVLEKGEVIFFGDTIEGLAIYNALDA